MLDRIEDRMAIEDLNARYARALDHNDLDAFVACFTPDAFYSLAGRESRGSAELASFFTGRQANGPRVTRHTYSGLVLSFEGPERASASSVWVSYVGSGTPPFHEALPFIVGDMLDVYRRVDGRWLVADRRITPVFLKASRP